MKKKISIPYFSCIFMWRHNYALCRKIVQKSKISIFGGYALIITILHSGILPNLLQYYIGEGGGLSGPEICSTLQINGRPRDKYCIAHSHEVSALDLFFNLVWKWGRIWSGEKTKLLVRWWKSKSGFPQSRMRLLLSRALVLKARKLHNSFLAF